MITATAPNWSAILDSFTLEARVGFSIPWSITLEGEPWTWATNGVLALAVRGNHDGHAPVRLTPNPLPFFTDALPHSEPWQMADLFALCNMAPASPATEPACDECADALGDTNPDPDCWDCNGTGLVGVYRLGLAGKLWKPASLTRLELCKRVFKAAVLFAALIDLPAGPVSLEYDDDPHHFLRVRGTGWICCVMPLDLSR